MVMRLYQKYFDLMLRRDLHIVILDSGMSMHCSCVVLCGVVWLLLFPQFSPSSRCRLAASLSPVFSLLSLFLHTYVHTHRSLSHSLTFALLSTEPSLAFSRIQQVYPNTIQTLEFLEGFDDFMFELV